MFEIETQIFKNYIIFIPFSFNIKIMKKIDVLV